jgi:uncharacterized protein
MWRTTATCVAGIASPQRELPWRAKLIPFEVGKRALDFLRERSGTRKHLEVDLFGGEPLMNWDVCKQLVAYGRELEQTFNKIIHFTIPQLRGVGR